MANVIPLNEDVMNTRSFWDWGGRVMPGLDQAERRTVATVRSRDGFYMAIHTDHAFGDLFYWTEDFCKARLYETPGAALLAAHDHDVGPCVITEWELNRVREVEA